MANAAAYLKAFYDNYEAIVTGLSVDNLYPKLMSKGLLKGKLSQEVRACKTDDEKARHILDSMKNGLEIGVTQVFEDFLIALKEYAEDNDDHVVRKIEADARKSISEAISSGWAAAEVAKHKSSSGQLPAVTLPALMIRLKKINDWQTFGIFLLPEANSNVMVQNIAMSNPGGSVNTCKTALLQLYLRAGEVSWQRVIYALDMMGDENLASELKKEFNM